MGLHQAGTASATAGQCMSLPSDYPCTYGCIHQGRPALHLFEELFAALRLCLRVFCSTPAGGRDPMSLVQVTTNAGSRLSLGLTALKAWERSSSTSVPAASDSQQAADNASAPPVQQQGASPSEAQAAGQHPWHSWGLLSNLASQQAALQEEAPKHRLALSGRSVPPPCSPFAELQQVTAHVCLSDANTGASPAPYIVLPSCVS